ncbi:putative cyclin domain-containing protein [Helianthus anomalus]
MADQRIAKRIALERIHALLHRHVVILDVPDETYVNDINAYLLQLQGDRRPNAAYLAHLQPDLNEDMRAQVINWMIGVADEYNLLPESVCLAVSLLDRFLSRNDIKRGVLQLVGTASLMIAAKCEELRRTPKAADYCDMAVDSFSVKQLLRKEAEVLRSLAFEVGDPTVITFVRRFTVVAHSQIEFQTSSLTLKALTQYLSELSLLEYELLQFWPNLIAAAVVFLARFTLKARLHPWNLDLQHVTGFRPPELRGCVGILQDLQCGRRAGNADLVRIKFRKRKFKHVANLTPNEIPDNFFEDI